MNTSNKEYKKRGHVSDPNVI